jgi:molybdate transport system regulatory protein
MKKKEIRVKCWVAIDDVKYFGPGPAELFELIEASGSISKAAKTMGMSYKKAWDIIEKTNARGKGPYVLAHKGGKDGGGATLTPTGKKVLASFRRLNEKIQTVVARETELLKWI